LGFVLAAPLLLGFPAASQEGGTPSEAQELADQFTRHIRPLLEAHCQKCHNSEKKKGGIDYTSLGEGRLVLRQRKTWKKVSEQVENGSMPPEKEKRLPDPDRHLLLTWVKKALLNVDCSDPRDWDPGPPLLRRLNRTEYTQTMRDLLSLDDLDAAEAAGIPEEPTGTGFDTMAASLVLPLSLLEKYFAAADLALDRVLSSPASKKQRASFDSIFVARPSDSLSKSAAARKIMESFVRRAYRRAPRPEELDRLLGLFERGQARGATFEASVRLMLKAVLCSPHFLFRVEEDRPAQEGQAPPVSDFELASRLSYFLWSTMPDAELLGLSEGGKLRDPAVLEAQVRRMLAHPKARALTRNFAEQWLQLKKLPLARPNTEFFPRFTGKMKQALHDETALFFDRLREEDRSVLELLDCDYAYVNEDLAGLYALEGVKGPELRRVALRPENHRGGLLGMGSILALTSHTFRTSPTLRGKWILEVIFGTPPPPPPPDAGVLKEDPHRKEPRTFREQMALHASKASCAGCHQRIDPLGFALENYDGIGSWRDAQSLGRPVDTAGELPTGEKLDGAASLKALLRERPDPFVRNLIEQMLVYALGREIQYHDECAVRQVKADLEAQGYRFTVLVVGLVRSFPFQHRRAAAKKE
jgi:mono/diheme cytochrome c family protein